MRNGVVGTTKRPISAIPVINNSAAADAAPISSSTTKMPSGPELAIRTCPTQSLAEATQTLAGYASSSPGRMIWLSTALGSGAGVGCCITMVADHSVVYVGSAELWCKRLGPHSSDASRDSTTGFAKSVESAAVRFVDLE
jgi:hypothetical protein